MNGIDLLVSREKGTVEKTVFPWTRGRKRRPEGKVREKNVKTCAFFDVFGQVFRNLRGKVVDRIKSKGVQTSVRRRVGKIWNRCIKNQQGRGGTVLGPGRGGHRTTSCGTQLFGLCGI